MRMILAIALVLALTLTADPVQAQSGARTLVSEAAFALQMGEFAQAEALYIEAYDASAGAYRDTVAFFVAFTAYRQGQALALSNVRGDVEIARTTLAHFERGRSFIDLAAHPDRAQVEDAIEQYIARQEAVIRSAGEARPAPG